jgi:hypothetical protein
MIEAGRPPPSIPGGKVPQEDGASVRLWRSPASRVASTAVNRDDGSHLQIGLVLELPRRFGISDPVFGRSWISRCHPSEHQANIVSAIGLDSGIEKDLLQNVLLRMTAAETVHSPERWFHEVHCTGVFTSPMGQHSLGYGQSYTFDDLRDGSVAAAKQAHCIKQSAGHVVASGRGQRHHPVRLRERREAITDPRFGLVRNFDPSIAHVDALTFQSKQHRCSILHIDI